MIVFLLPSLFIIIDLNEEVKENIQKIVKDRPSLTQANSNSKKHLSRI
jgi:hypothetical protein